MIYLKVDFGRRWYDTWFPLKFKWGQTLRFWEFRHFYFAQDLDAPIPFSIIIRFSLVLPIGLILPVLMLLPEIVTVCPSCFSASILFYFLRLALMRLAINFTLIVFQFECLR
jgi:hypothetical protein